MTYTRPLSSQKVLICSKLLWSRTEETCAGIEQNNFPIHQLFCNFALYYKIRISLLKNYHTTN